MTGILEIYLTQYVSISGFDVKLGRDGKEAWELFNKDKPDICVFDVMMPEMDGFTLAEKVKEASSRYSGNISDCQKSEGRYCKRSEDRS